MNKNLKNVLLFIGIPIAFIISVLSVSYLSKNTVETKYYDSSEYKAHQDYNGLIEKLKDFKGVAILIDLIVCVLLSYALIIFNVNFLYVILLFIITVVIFYLLYQQGTKYYLNKQKPAPIPSLESVIEEAKMSYEYQQIPNSLLANHMRDEIEKLNQQLSELEATLIEKTVLPEIYRMRAKEVVWYLENLMADNLKEALAALVEDDHREQVKQMIEEAKLMEHNQKLAHKLEQQRQQLVELENRKK